MMHLQVKRTAINNPGKFIREAQVEVIKDAIGMAHSLAIQNIQTHKMSDTGGLERSLHPDFSKAEKSLEGRVWTNAPHAAAHEFGSGPSAETPRPQYWPPRKPLEKWAGRKLGLSEKDAKRASFAIQYKIHERGLRPRPYLRPAADQVQRMLPGLLKKHLGVLARRYMSAGQRTEIGG